MNDSRKDDGTNITTNSGEGHAALPAWKESGGTVRTASLSSPQGGSATQASGLVGTQAFHFEWARRGLVAASAKCHQPALPWPLDDDA